MSTVGTRPQDLRRKNARYMLRLLSETSSLTINEITGRMNLSRTAVQNILSEFIQGGLVEEKEKRASTRLGGKRAASYAICAGYRYSFFLYLSTENVLVELNDFALNQISCRIADVVHFSYEEMVQQVAELIQMMMRTENVLPEQIYGIAAAISGMVDSENGVLLEFTGRDTQSRWGRNRYFAKDLQNQLGFSPDIFVDNMCNFSGYASYLSSTEGGANSCVYILAHSNGIGATFLQNGKIFRGAHNLTGEIGHTAMEGKSYVRCRCGRMGCFESLLYPESIRNAACNAAENGAKVDPNSIQSMDDLLRLAEKGNAYAAEEVERIGRLFARLFYNIQLMVDPECIIFHDAFPVHSGVLHRALEKACSEEGKHLLKVPIQILFDEGLFTERVRRGAALCLRARFLNQTRKDNGEPL